MSYIWIQSTFGWETNSSLKAVPNKHLQAVYFPNNLPVSSQKKYSNFYLESNKNLTHFITQKIFESWRSQVIQIKMIKKQRNSRTLKDILSFWKEYSTNRMIQRAKFNEVANRHNLYTLSEVFGSLKEHLQIKISLNKRWALLSACSGLNTQKRYLYEWRIQYK